VALISLRDVSVAFGSDALLDGVTLHVEERERISLVGRNGAGKSTLLRLIAGEVAVDRGVVERRQGLRIGMLVQDVPAAESGTIVQVVSEGLDAADRGAEGRRRVEATLSQMELDGEVAFAPLSAGNKRRVLLARALARDPDLLLLDEPTNHLDIPAIDWIERYLRRSERTVVFVSHDRAFTQALATRVIALDCGRLYSFPGSYRDFERRRQEALEAEEKQAAELDKKLAEEEAWIRRGVKARAVRNMGRVRALERLRAERAARRQRTGTARMTIHDAERSGKLVFEAEGVTAGYDGDVVVRDFSTIVLRGDRVAIIGPNGCGKTTLLRVLLGTLEPTEGSVRLGANVALAYFDQLRGELDENATVAENVVRGDHVTVGGKPRHVIGYLEDFLFAPDRARSPVRSLSGGEKNRLLLAKLFLKPSNVLVLDEPTNDLDVETLELLEERIVAYPGTVVVVSHDRTFVDNVATSTIAYVSDGRFVEHAGGYSDWLACERASDMQPSEAKTKAKAETGERKKAKTATARKLSFKEQRELEALPSQIEALEGEQSELHTRMADPSFYASGDGAAVIAATERLEAVEAELERTYERWQLLEEIASASSLEK
jgi:ABC transport system ATP-binding/permease protein